MTTVDRVRHLTDDQLIGALERMLRIRRFEQRVQRLFKQGRLPGFVHLYIGQEAVAVGTALALDDGDQITSNHRGHGHVIARGGDVGRMFAELLGKADGYCGGKGGSMHIVNFADGMLGTNGIVGGGIPIATGAAFANRHTGNGHVAVSFFGDGASNQGVLFEALNLAALWSLPVIFLCENNQYTEWSRTEELTAGSIPARAEPFGVPGVTVDGNDVEAVHDTVAEAVHRARTGDGPTLVEAVTYRWHGHNEGEEVFAGNYRPDDEIEQWRAKDPIQRLRDALTDRGVLDDDRFEAIESEQSEVIETGLAFAQDSPMPDPSEALTDVFAGDDGASDGESAEGHAAEEGGR